MIAALIERTERKTARKTDRQTDGHDKWNMALFETK
jgi:hypothetical protein